MGILFQSNEDIRLTGNCDPKVNISSSNRDTRKQGEQMLKQ